MFAIQRDEMGRLWLISYPLVGPVKLNCDGVHSLNNLGWLDIGGVIRDYLGTLMRAYFKLTGVVSALRGI